MQFEKKAEYTSYKCFAGIANSSPIPTQSKKESIRVIWGKDYKRCEFCGWWGHWHTIWPHCKVRFSLPPFLTCKKENKCIYLNEIIPQSK